MNFEFTTANRIVFGPGRFGQIGNIARAFGRRAFVITGRQALKDSGKLDVLRQALAGNDIEFVHFAGHGEPEIETVELAAAEARREVCDLVIGVGGGSVIDLAKAVAGLITNEGSLVDYLEVIGRGRALQKPAAPLIAAPTTAGTGAEVTANAVIKDPTSKQKISLRSPFLLPKIALVDPELTYSLPAEITAQSGMDTLVHLVEAYTSKRAQPLTDLFCRDGIVRTGRSLVKAYENGEDRGAREDMALSSLQGGIVLANAGLGAVHGIAAVLGGSYPIPHGVACACLLRHVFEANAFKLSSIPSNYAVFRRYLDVSEWLAGGGQRSDDDTFGLGLESILELIRRLKIPTLAEFGVREEDLPEIARKSAHASSTRANPVDLSQEEFVGILRKALA
jgi:alcohol dehydrogenase class IV